MTAPNAELEARRAEMAAIRRLALPLLLGIDEEAARRIAVEQANAERHESRSGRVFLDRVLAPYVRPTDAAADVGATPPTASASASGSVDRHVPLARGTRGGQPPTPIEETVARLIADLEGA